MPVVRDYKSSHYKEEKKLVDDLQVEWLEGLDSPALPVLMESKGRLMWDHDGVCVCGRRTYLFGQCLRCLENERDDEERERAQADFEQEPVVVEEDVPPAAGPTDVSLSHIDGCPQSMFRKAQVWRCVVDIRSLRYC